jgi:hypothetical protein
MEQKYTSHSELKNFVQSHKLRNSHSLINFISIVTIETAENKITNREMEILITFDGYDNYGSISLLENELDPYAYPTKFFAKHQEMKYVNGEFLLIKGNHTKNPAIGNYEVKIIPLNRLRE